MEYLTEDDYKIAEANGISYNHAYQRYYVREWSKEDAITKPIRTRTSQWPDYKELAKSNGICEGTFRSRVKRLGMSPEEAATKPLDPKQSKRRRDYENTRV